MTSIVTDPIRGRTGQVVNNRVFVMHSGRRGLGMPATMMPVICCDRLVFSWVFTVRKAGGANLARVISDRVLITRLLLPRRVTLKSTWPSWIIGLRLLAGRLIRNVVIWPVGACRLTLRMSIGITVWTARWSLMPLRWATNYVCNVLVTMVSMILPTALLRLWWTCPKLLRLVAVALKWCRVLTGMPRGSLVGGWVVA